MKCTDCGFDNDDGSARCKQCGAELKKGAYVVSPSSSLKRLEREKLSFLNTGDIVSKFDEEKVAQYAVMAPMDPSDIERLVHTEDETEEIKSLAANGLVPPESIKRDGTDNWSPADEVSVVMGADSTLSFGLPHGPSREPTRHCLPAQSDGAMGAKDVPGDCAPENQGTAAMPCKTDSLFGSMQSFSLSAAFDGIRASGRDAIDDFQDISRDAHTLYGDKPALSFDDDFQDISRDAHTLYGEGACGGLSAISNASLYDADQGDLGGRTVYEEVQDIEAVEIGSESLGTGNSFEKRLKALQGIEKLESFQNVDSDIVLEEDKPHDGQRESVYGLLPVENAHVSTELHTSSPAAIASAVDVEQSKPRARVLRHDFRMMKRASVPKNASAMEKLKAQGVFEAPKAHAEVSRNIDSLLVDNYFPRAELETWHGEVILDAADPSLRCYSFVEGQSLMTSCAVDEGLKERLLKVQHKLNNDDADEKDADVSDVIGSVYSLAPDNEVLAGIADKITPKNSAETSDDAVLQRSMEIACPYNADSEKVKDQKILDDIEVDEALFEGTQDEEKEEGFVSSKEPVEKKPKTQHLLVVDEEEDEEEVSWHERRSSKSLEAPRISLRDLQLVGPDASPTAVVDKKAIESEPGRLSVASLVWAFVILLFIVGIVYLSYLMGFFAGIDPRLDPHKPRVTPQFGNLPTYEDPAENLSLAMGELSQKVHAAFHYENYLHEYIVAELDALTLDDPDYSRQKLELNDFGHEFYPDDERFVTGKLDALFESQRFDLARQFMGTLPETLQGSERMRKYRLRSFTEDPRFISEVWTVTENDFQDISPLGGGSTVTLKFMNAGKPEAAFKPLQTRLQSNYRAEIAAWRLCELIDCDFKVPYNREVRVDHETFYKLYGRSRSSKAAAYRKELADLTWKKDAVDGKRYLYGTYKEWIPGFTRFPIELTRVWKAWLVLEPPVTHFPALDRALSPIARNQHTSKLYSEIMKLSPELTAEKLAAQISEVLVFDFLLGNWDRFSGVPQWWGVNCQFKDSQIVSIDNGAGFQWGGNDKVTERYMMVERFSRHFVRNLRELDKETAYSLLFPNPDENDERGFRQFWKQREAFLKRVDELIAKYGEEAVLFFP